MTDADDLRDTSQHVGPIIFSDRTARRQLTEEGEVVTFRSTKRTTGDTWWRESRTGPKKGDVHVELVEEGLDALDLDDLDHYHETSGFVSAEEWQDAIFDLNGSLDVGYLYRATVIGE